MANLGFGAPNVFGQSANWLTQAGNMAGQAGSYQPNQVRNPQDVRAATVQAGQLSNTNLQQYQNPYTNQVINRAMGDLDRSRQMAMNQTGAQATSAGAFGGSRHGVMEAETNRAFFDQAGDMAAGLRNQGFQNAQQAAQFDIGNKMQAGLANQQSQNSMGQFNSAQGMQSQLANQQAGLAGAGLGLQGAGMLGNLSNLGFGQGMQINQQQQQQGAQQQALMQQLINAGKGQWGGFTGQPSSSLGPLIAMLGGVGGSQNTQSSNQSPGLLGGLGGLLGFL